MVGSLMNITFNTDGSSISSADGSASPNAEGLNSSSADGSGPKTGGFTANAEGSLTNAEGSVANAEGSPANAEGDLANAEGSITLRLHGQTLSLLCERALLWHEHNMLIVADVHLGKAQTFQRAGIAIPGHSLDDDLQRLSAVLAKTRARHLLVLGDFVHHRNGLTPLVRQKIATWCAALDADITLILGNHDQPNTPFLKTLPMCIVHSFEQAPFIFTHDSIPTIPTDNEHFVFMGHLHPVMSFHGANIRLPAFAFYKHHSVLPAFSYFTGGWVVERQGLQAVFGVVDGVKVWANAEGNLQQG
jgi:DNA ligase-associated metallophosphoesterase